MNKPVSPSADIIFRTLIYLMVIGLIYAGRWVLAKLAKNRQKNEEKNINKNTSDEK